MLDELRPPRRASTTAALSAVALGIALSPTSARGGANPVPKAAAAAASTETLVLDGVPEAPAALRERMAPYLDSRAADVTGISDDGRALLVTTRFAETAQVHLVRGPLGARRQLTFRKEPVQAATFVPGSDGSVVFAADRGGDENYQLFRLDLDTQVTTLLTDGKSRNTDYRWSKQGDRLVFASNARNGRDMDLWVSDAKPGSRPELLLERQGTWAPVDWSRDGKRLLIRQYVSIAESHLFLVDLETRATTRVTPEKPAAAYRMALFGPTGKSLYVTTDREGEFVELYELDLAKGSWTPLSRHIPWSVEDVALSPDGKTLAFATNEGGFSVVHLLDTRTRREERVKDLPPCVLSSMEFARKANTLALAFSGATRPNDAYTLDLARKKLVRWTESELGGMNPARFVEPTAISVTSFDGRQIPALYYKPSGPGPHPVMLDIHGGPEGQARPWFSTLTQWWVAEAGIAVVVPNVRGSDGYGKTYLSLDNGFERKKSVQDLGAFLDWIATRPELDAQRTGVYGGSYGGFMVLAALVEYGDRIRAGVDIVGISNLVGFLERTSEYRRDLRRAEYGDERDPKMREFLNQISPLTRVQEIRSKLLVAQGANDPRVPAAESEQIVQAVRKQGHEVWYLLAKNEGHGFRRKENRDAFALTAAMFFERYLAGAPASR